MWLISRTIEEMLMARGTVIFFLQQLGFVLHLKKSVLTPTQRTQSAITCSKLTVETLEQGVKYVQS